MADTPVAITSLRRYERDIVTSDQDLVAVEAPLSLDVRTVDGQTRPLGVLMRTPGHDRELALGVLVSEGVVWRQRDVAAVEAKSVDGEGITVTLSASAKVDALVERAAAGTSGTSACGLCGRLSMRALDQAPSTTPGEPFAVAADLIAELPDRLRSAQRAFAETGGLHAAGLFAEDGTLSLAREDVGRHNAVDKVAGALFEAGQLPSTDAILTVSGRIAYEIVQKAAACGIPVIVAVGAPTTLAVEAARAAGITLVGFTRGGRFNVYSGFERVE